MGVTDAVGNRLAVAVLSTVAVGGAGVGAIGVGDGVAGHVVATTWVGVGAGVPVGVGSTVRTAACGTPLHAASASTIAAYQMPRTHSKRRLFWSGAC